MSKLKEIRTAAGLTQDKLAEITGISQANICRIENGINIPTIETAKKLAVALNCKIDDLI